MPTATLQAAAHPWIAVLDVKSMFFTVPVRRIKRNLLLLGKVQNTFSLVLKPSEVILAHVSCKELQEWARSSSVGIPCPLLPPVKWDGKKRQ